MGWAGDCFGSARPFGVDCLPLLWGELLAEAEVMRSIAGRLPTKFETVPIAEEPDPWAAPEGSATPRSEALSQELFDPDVAGLPVDFEPEVWPDAAEMPQFGDGPENDADTDSNGGEFHRRPPPPVGEPVLPPPVDYNQPGFVFPEGFPPGYAPPPGYRPHRSGPYEPPATGSAPATPQAPDVLSESSPTLPGPSPTAPRPPGEPNPQACQSAFV